ncbi:hypothetical protein [Spirosoma pomorum]
MAGEYAITGTASYTIDGAVSRAPLSGTLSVYAGNDANTYYFLERYGTTELGYLISYTNNNFTVQEVPDYSYYNSVKYFGYQKGGGTLATNKITIDRSAATNTTTYIAPTGQVSYGTKNITKRVLITATKVQ